MADVTLDDLALRYPGAVTFRFGDTGQLSAELLALVRAGAKTATCGAARDFREGGEPLPQVGRCDIALNWDGTPALVIRTLSLERRRFCDMDAESALAEGENDDLAGWQRAHRAYFERTSGWDADMELICERFEMVEDLGGCSSAS